MYWGHEEVVIDEIHRVLNFNVYDRRGLPDLYNDDAIRYIDPHGFIHAL